MPHCFAIKEIELKTSCCLWLQKSIRTSKLGSFTYVKLFRILECLQIVEDVVEQYSILRSNKKTHIFHAT